MYQDLYEMIEWPNEFDFGKWNEHEDKYIKPLLEEKGYRNIEFIMGERDSFGPLTRVVCMEMPNGTKIKAIYG